jgi:hypothetical protein
VSLGRAKMVVNSEGWEVALVFVLPFFDRFAVG